MAIRQAPADQPMLVLASGSRTRARMLEQAGVAFAIDPPAIDENRIKSDGLRRGLALDATVLHLAGAKARLVSERHPDSLVIGADQMLDCEGRRFDKPMSMEGARTQLLALRGRVHRLASGVCLVRHGVVVWQAGDVAELAMRDFTEAFLDGYLRAVDTEVLESVGAYQIEGLGIQLFERVRGDHFTILGLPLLALLGALRDQGILSA